jgi:ATP-dependent Clp protease ATP-binding subunit ClpC
VVFFSRYEASQLGSTSIESEHLLLGLIRELQGLASRILTTSQVASLENIRKRIETQTELREKVGRSAEIPFSAQTKRALEGAAEEADRLLHNHIGPEHLLLGLLRDEASLAGSILRENGFELAALRDKVSEMAQTPAGGEIGSRDKGARRPLGEFAVPSRVGDRADSVVRRAAAGPFPALTLR